MRWQSQSLIPSCLLLPLVSGHVVPSPRPDTWGPGKVQAKTAIDAMMGFYNETAGRWQPEIAWWLSGNALQTLLDYMHKTGDASYMPQVLRTIDTQREPLDWWPEGGGYFRADSTDDTGWWALAMVRMFDVTGDATYLGYARLDEDYMRSYWSDECGGGIIWDIRRLVYKNAISNELYFALAAALHNRLPGDEVYLNRSLEAWDWFEASGMINSAFLVNDGLTEDSCVNNNATTWTYNQGVILGGLVELYRATKNQRYIAVAKQIADAVVGSGTLVVNGVLREPCEAAGDCDYNQQAFKGIFMRYLGVLDEVLCSTHPYRAFIRSNAETAWRGDRNETDYFDVSWHGPFDAATVATQASAASLMVAAMDLGAWERGGECGATGGRVGSGVP
ncbi:putative glycosyl hydrolase [Coniochaeta ligniaria NRRL 30616]|uniref:Putative glycosyl hydrolase n=1 Tax=Coniochaeta ligniaria NRRL 30616 TaxID=1408157 RepID=A0A1J7IZR4_9PEZI|nr:putative glycosyl hydrolase [Coniochaeta ligniaria NRRL 30616]